MRTVVESMTLLFLQLQQALQRLNLSINMEKSGFLCSHACVRKALKQYQQQHFPSYVFPRTLDCIRDLGIDNTVGRLRRLPTSKKRITKSLRRAARISQTPRRLRKNLVQTSILASGLWGAQGLGLAPTTLRTYRARIARSGGFVHKLGCLTTGWRLFASRAVDPMHKTLMQQVSGFFDVFNALSPKLQDQVRRVWRLSYQLIAAKVSHWHYARGPLSAFMCRLKDLNWKTPDLNTWYDNHGNPHAVDVGRPLAQSQLGYLLEQSQEEQLWLQPSRHVGGKGLEHGADLTVAIKHLQMLTSFKQKRALLALAQGSIPCLENNVMPTCPFCHKDASLTHLLYQCEKLNDTYGAAPAEWMHDIHKPDKQCYWHRTITPSPWTHIKELTRKKYEGHAEETGIWALNQRLEDPRYRYGTDGSGGFKDRRFKLCGWGVSVVALSHDGRWECLGTKAGVLPGPKQTVPRAELYALASLLDSTKGNVEFSCDSQITVRTLRRVINTRKLRTKTPHADLWLKVQAHLVGRSVYPVWVNSHLDLEAFQTKFGPDLDWAHLSNDHADRCAGNITHWLSLRPDVRTYADINAWIDHRALCIQKHLIPRVQGILEATGT